MKNTNDRILRTVVDKVFQLLRRCDVTRAAQVLRQTINTLPPTKVRAFLNLWLASLESINKNSSEATRLCRMAERDDPTGSTTRAIIGTLLSAQKGSERQVRKKAREALRLATTRGQEAGAHALMAKCFLRVRMHPAAQRSLNKYRTAWLASREKSPEAVFLDLSLLKEFLAAGLPVPDYQNLLRIALRRARRQKVGSVYKEDLVRLIARTQ